MLGNSSPAVQARPRPGRGRWVLGNSSMGRVVRLGSMGSRVVRGRSKERLVVRSKGGPGSTGSLVRPVRSTGDRRSMGRRRARSTGSLEEQARSTGRYQTRRAQATGTGLFWLLVVVGPGGLGRWVLSGWCSRRSWSPG